MKIFYAVQATGNGHISRAMTLLPYLQQYGEVDIFLSGDNAHLPLNGPVKYRSRGISLFYNCTGGLDYWEITRKLSPLRIQREIREMPVEKYDLVLNDFDYITSAACARKKVPSVHFGHQASFYSAKTPRPEKRSRPGEWVLTRFVKASAHTGYHFDHYDKGIFTPVVKKEILEAVPLTEDHITIYLPAWCEAQITPLLQSITDHRFQVFSRETTIIREEKNIQYMPVDRELFTRSMIGCAGIVCGAGFETPAEAIHLGKKMMCIPISGQYEQQCNAAALAQMGIRCLPAIDAQFGTHFNEWINNDLPAVKRDYSNSIADSLAYLFSLTPSLLPVSVKSDAAETAALL
jgi:uncharacterized protein (TIGR00661 family)